jgi:hypothetical protein
MCTYFQVFLKHKADIMNHFRQVRCSRHSACLCDLALANHAAKGHLLSLTPVYVEMAHHATSLIRLSPVGLRVLMLLEFVVRERLAAARPSAF